MFARSIAPVGLFLVVWTTTSAYLPQYTSFTKRSVSKSRLNLNDSFFCNDQEPHNNEPVVSRRTILGSAALGVGVLVSPLENAYAETARPALRPTAYYVDSTIPPTLIPLPSVGKEMRTLTNLGKGSGTNKEAVVVDRLNLNNVLNKIVFGAIDSVSKVTSGLKDESKSGEGYASFVCLGVPENTSAQDVDLAVDLLTPIVQPRKAPTALGLAFCPLSSQSALDSYSQQATDESALEDALLQKGVSESTFQLYLPLFRFARRKSLALLAMSPELEDLQTVRADGLQNVDVDRRSTYVIDPEGFIGLSKDPRFTLYTERSLLKDFEPRNDKDRPGNFFAERILVHEAGATAVARFAAQRSDSLVAVVAPIPDVRFLNGINGRIPRVCKFLNPASKVTDNAVTTILINPTAEETLSKSRFLRLEIGTSPETLEYQTKVADYLWFSSSPKVNLIPRLMNP